MLLFSALWHLRHTIAHGWSTNGILEHFEQWGVPVSPADDETAGASSDLLYYAELDELLLDLATFDEELRHETDGVPVAVAGGSSAEL